MNLRGFVGSVVRRIGGGMLRFASFDVGALLLVVWLIWLNHVDKGGSGKETSRLVLSLACGTCWGMLSALVSRLALEKRAVRAWTLHAVPAILGVVMAVLGALFWFHVREDSAHYVQLQMVYAGGIVALVASAIVCLFGERNRKTLFAQLVQPAVFVCLLSYVASFGLAICFLACKTLLFSSLPDNVILDVLAFVWCFMAPVMMASLLPREDVDAGPSRPYEVLAWVLTPIGVLLLAILYAYLAKIVVNWTMPAGTLNWYASCAIAIYVFFWLSFRSSRVRFCSAVVRLGWLALLPVVFMQIIGIVIRFQAYGLTSMRMAGMVALALGIYALVLAAMECDARSLFVAVAVAGIVFTVSPLNIVDVPIREQSHRLRCALERAGCLVDGKFSIPEAPNLSDADARIVASAWRYLVGKKGVIKSVWHKPAFVYDVVDAVAAQQEKKGAKKATPLDGLINALNINETALAVAANGQRTTHYIFAVKGNSRLDVSGYSKVLPNACASLEFEDGRYFVVSRPATGSRESAKTDVTEVVRRILSSSAVGAKTIPQDYYVNGDLPDAVAVWKISGDAAIAVRRFTVTFKAADVARDGVDAVPVLCNVDGTVFAR